MSACLKIFTPRQWLLGVLLGLLAVMDPFGVTSSSDAVSAKWLNRVAAHFYPTQGQQQVAVVLIDDAYLDSHDTYWPLPYDEQSKLFKRLLAAKPRAVFVDLMFSHDHSGGDPARSPELLANVFERFQRQGIPLYVANSGRKAGDATEANARGPLVAVTQPALVSWSEQSDQYPLALATGLGLMETPAMALYRHYCQGRACAGLPKDVQAASEASPIAVQWGNEPPAQQALVSRLGNCNTGQASLLGAIGEFFEGLVAKRKGSDKGRCPYTLTLNASDLEANSAEDRELVRSLLQDRLVLVGADITSANDVVTSPVHGSIPGVYLHAMALDNLISKGMSYNHDPDSMPIGGFEVTWVDAIELTLLVLIAVLKKLTGDSESAKHFPAWAKRWHRRLHNRTLGTWSAFVALVLLLTGVLYLLHITPANVLGIGTLSLALFGDKVDQFFSKPPAPEKGNQG